MQLRNKVRLLHFLIKRVKSLKGIAYLKEEMGNVLLSRYLNSPIIYLLKSIQDMNTLATTLVFSALNSILKKAYLSSFSCRRLIRSSADTVSERSTNIPCTGETIRSSLAQEKQQERAVRILQKSTSSSLYYDKYIVVSSTCLLFEHLKFFKAPYMSSYVPYIFFISQVYQPSCSTSSSRRREGTQ